MGGPEAWEKNPDKISDTDIPQIYRPPQEGELHVLPLCIPTIGFIVSPTNGMAYLTR